MRRFSAATSFIANGKGSPQSDEIIEFQGYDDPGDGGGAQWRFTGVTGQTVSQSPAQLADALLNDANGNQWALVIQDTISAASLGFSVSSSDSTAVFNAIKKASLGGAIHIAVTWPSGDFTFTQAISIDPTDTPNLTTSIRNITWNGAGGMAQDLGTRFKFEVVSSVDCFKIDSSFNTIINNMCFRSSNDCETIVKINAGVSPAFSGSLMKFSGCHVQLGGSATAAEASMWVINSKLVKLDTCFLTVGSTEDVTVLRLGDDAANQAGTLQQGVVHNAQLDNCFLFGRTDIRNCKQWTIDGSIYGEAEHARIMSSGDQRMQSGRLINTGFVGDSEEAAFTQGNFVNGADTGEEAGWVTIDNCEFRDRKICAQITVGNVTMKNNEFFIRRAGDKGVVIDSGAEHVHIHPSNNFRQAYRNDTVAIEDNRQGSNFIVNVDQDILVSEWLAANNVLSNFGNFEEILTSGSVDWRGGKCRITAKASILNNSGTSQRFRMKITFQEDVNLNTLPMSTTTEIISTDDGELYASLIVSIPYFTTTTQFKLYIQADAADDATVRGSTDGDTTLGSTYLQVEEWH